MDTGYDGSQYNNISSNKNYNTRLERSTVQIRNALSALQEVTDQQTETSKCHRKIKKKVLLKSQKKQCSSKLTLVVRIPTKKRQTSEKYPYLLTHGSIEIEFYSQSSTDFCTLSAFEMSVKKLNKLFSIFLVLGIAHLLRNTPMSNS